MIDYEFQKDEGSANIDMADDPRLPKLGDTIGNCRITSVLGEGGVGIVYKGFELDIEMERAIKMLKPGSIDLLRKQFETEGKVTARLDHPNIIKVHGGGIWDGKLPYIQMEYIDGRSLRTFLDENPTHHPVVCLSIISLIASALDYAYGKSFSIWGNHSDKLVHLDLKPENLLISRDGTLKVMDFGLAQLGGEKYQLDWGTPSYMSPEQHDQLNIDCRSDIFSLGVIFYEMLCGTRPFPDKFEQMISAKVSGNYKPLKVLCPSVSDKACTIIDKCLKANREERYETHPSLRQAVNDALSELTSQTPQELIRCLSDNPDFQPVLISPSKRFPIGKCIIFAALPVFTIIVLSFLFFTRTEKKAESKTQITVSNQKNQVIDSIEISPIPKAANPVKVDTIQIVTAVQKKARASKATKSSVESKSVLNEAIKFYKKKDFTSTIVSINSLSLNKLPEPTRDSAIILLTDSYYQTRSIREIIDLSSKYDINDSRFYSIVSLAYEIAPDFITAAQYFDKAIMAPSILWKQPRAELLHERAGFYKRRFNAMQDEASKASMIEAVRRFLNEGCGTEKPQCHKEREFLKAYE